MKTIPFLLPILLILIGVSLAIERVWFITTAQKIDGVVNLKVPYRGPPRSPRNIPLDVKYSLNGGEQTVAIPSPMFRKFKDGDSIPLLVSEINPTDVRAPYLAEIWYYPLAFVFAGIGLAALIFAARRVKHQS